MKHQLILLILLHNCFIAFAQEKYIYEFDKIETDTIFKKDSINIVIGDATLFADKFFISYYQNNRIPSLYKKEDNFCISFDLGFSDETNYEIIGQSENQQFLYIREDGDHSAGQTAFGHKTLYIVDIKNNTYLCIEYYSSVSYWGVDENNPSEFPITKEYTVNSSKIAFTKKGFTAITNLFGITSDIKIDYDVIQSGEYELDEFQLKKTKYYDEKSMKFLPIKYIGDIAIGMTLEDLNLVCPYCSFVEKENIYGTCAEENPFGFEVWDGNELLGYVNNNIAENRITNFKAIAPKFNFGKLNTNSTASEVLKYFPKSNVRLDLLTEWEHIYVKELNIELVFKTNDSNRIGKYKNEDFVKLKNGKTKVDYIQVY